MAVFDRKEIEERLKQKAIERERKEHIRKLTSPAYRKKLQEQMKREGKCVCGNPSAVPTGWCVECWNKLESYIRGEYHSPNN